MRRTRRRERGQALTVVSAIVVLVGVALVLVSAVLAGRRARLEHTRDQMRIEADRLRDEHTELFTRAREILPVSGWVEPPITQPVDAVDVPDRATLLTLLSNGETNLRTAVVETRTWVIERLTEVPALPVGPAPELPGNLASLRAALTQNPETLVAGRDPTGALDTYLALAPHLWSYAQVYAAWEVFATGEKRQAEAGRIPDDLGPSLAQPFSAQRDEIQRRLTETRETRTREQAGHTDAIGRIDQEIRDTQTRIGQLINPWEANEKPEMERHERSLVAELSRMRVLEARRFEVLEAHGRILAPQADRRRASIDRGARDRVVAGLRFLVGRRGNRGRLEPKGKVEVRRVDEGLAHVEILEETRPWNPIVEGDLIWNPFYNPRRPVVVAVIGDEGVPGASFGKTDLVATLRGLGVDVRATIDPDVDFVAGTAGYQAKPEHHLALQIELPVAEPSLYVPFLE